MGAPHVVRGERNHASRRCPIAQDNGHPLIRQPLLSYPFDGLCSSKLSASVPPAHSSHAPKAVIVPEGA